MAAAEVETSRDDGVLTITLNRPDVLNAFNTAMHEALGAALKEARDPEVRAVVVTGAGRGFCVGQDLTEFSDAARDIAGHLRKSYHPTIHAVRALEKPVIATALPDPRRTRTAATEGDRRSTTSMTVLEYASSSSETKVSSMRRR